MWLATCLKNDEDKIFKNVKNVNTNVTKILKNYKFISANNCLHCMAHEFCDFNAHQKQVVRSIRLPLR